MDWNHLVLETTQEQKSISGGGLLSLRGISSADFGNTATTYDSNGRKWVTTATRGTFTATDTRTYFGTTPLCQDLVKTLTDSSSGPIAGSGQVGTHYYYDASPFHWLLLKPISWMA